MSKLSYRLIKMTSLTLVSSGSYGTYYKIKGTDEGVKIIDRGWYDSESSAVEGLRDLRSGEYSKLVKASKRTRLVPRPKGLVVVVCRNGEHKIGYAMSHVKGRTILDSYLSRKNRRALSDAVYHLARRGIQLRDNHGNNIIMRAGKFTFIDADRFVICPLKKKRKKKRSAT